MTIREITDYLESIAPLALQESYDNCGLIVGEPTQKISRILVTLDCTEEVVAEALETGCELIIAHHPIVFSGLKKLNGKNYVERTVIKAIKNNVAIYAIHTNLDNVQNGVNAEIAKRLELTELSILQPKNNLLTKLVTFIPTENVEAVSTALFAAGAGHIGNYSDASFRQEGIGTFKGDETTHPQIGTAGKLVRVAEFRFETIVPNHKLAAVLSALKSAHPYEEVAYDLIPLTNEHQGIGSGMVGRLSMSLTEADFLGYVKEKLATNTIRYTTVGERKIQKVALCGGSGQFLLGAAKRAGADAFITGDFKYHEFFDAEGQILIADIGHYESEQFTKNLIVELLSEKFPTFAVLISKINTNPVNYF